MEYKVFFNYDDPFWIKFTTQDKTTAELLEMLNKHDIILEQHHITFPSKDAYLLFLLSID